MNKNEDYLDDLLRSVSERDNRRDIADLLHTVREDEERTRREQESRKRRREFGKQFFQELEHELSEPEEYDDLVRGFELELDAEEAGIRVDEFQEDLLGNMGTKKEPLTDEQLIENINGIVEGAKKRVEGSESDGAEEYDLTNVLAGISPDEALEEDSGEAVSILNTEDSAETEQIQDEAALGEDNADDLLEMLSGLTEDTDLSDIGSMLKADEEGEAVVADEASDLEMLESIDELAGLVSGKDEKKKKEKKNGFFARFLKALFGEDEEELAPVQVSEENELENLSDENLDILRELDSAEKKEAEPKKEKRKKEKKEKKEKKPKEKKEKKVKPKKEKKPKEPDLSPPLPKKPVILITVMAASIFLLILLGSNFMSYSEDLSASKESYRNGRYVEAYTTISGRNVKSGDQQFYNQCAVMAMIEEEYQAYVALMDAKEYTMALDSLIRGIGRYDKYYEKAAEYDILPEYDELGQKIEQVLGEQFGMTSDQARELYGMRRREDYSIGVRLILESLGLE